jgi:uncharacterized protein YndB with AHSA1/START domain
MQNDTMTPDRTPSLEERGELKETRSPGRIIEDAVTLDVAPEVVWRAITDADELVRWFPLAATVEPGVGGTIALSWGEPGSEKAVIEIWEPNRRLRTVDRRRDATGRLVEIAVDFLIEAKGWRTTLRVVHAGFGAGAEWDQEYDGTMRGWGYELRGLRHYLSRHAGVDRQVASAQAATSVSPETTYAWVMGPEGLVSTGSLAGLTEGDRYRIGGAAGGFEGTVLVNRPPLDFSGTVSNLNEALLRYEFYGGSVRLWVATWGVDVTRVRELENQLRTVISGVGRLVAAAPA